MTLTQAFAGLLTGTFMTGVAAAQDFSQLEFAKPVRPYEDLNVSIQDLTVKHTDPALARGLDSGQYRFADRLCGTGEDSLVSLYRWDDARIQDTVSSEYYAEHRQDPGRSHIVIGKDGSLYDMNIKDTFNKYMRGEIKTGVLPGSPELIKAARSLAEGCAPQM